MAHNASNQALIGAACGWGPAAFRRLEQSNGGATRLEFTPGSAPDQPAVATLVQVNASSERWTARAEPGCIVLAAAPEEVSLKVPLLLASLLHAPPVGALLSATDASSRSFACAIAASVPAPIALLGEDTSADAAWSSALQASQLCRASGACVMLIADARSLARIICAALELPAACSHAVRVDAARVSVLRPSKVPGGAATALCLNVSE